MIQQEFTRLSITAARIITQHTALITPENMNLGPIHFVAKLIGKNLKEATGSSAAVECNQAATSFGNRLCRLFSKQSSCRVAEFLNILENADLRFHTFAM